METSPVKQGGQAFEAEKGALPIWSSGGMLDDGEWGESWRWGEGGPLLSVRWIPTAL